MLESGKRTQVIQMKRSVGMGNVSGYYSLTEDGRVRAREYLEENQYVGPAPVPLWQYEHMTRRQRQAEGWLSTAGTGACLPQVDPEPGNPATDRAGREFRQLLPDLRTAGQWQDVSRRNAC